MKDIYLFNPIEETKYRERGESSKEVIKEKLRLVNRVDRFTKTYVREQLQHFIHYVETAFANRKYMNMMLTYEVPYRLHANDEKRSLPVIPFMYFMILAGPLAEKGVKLDKSYIFNPPSSRIGKEIEDYIDRFYILQNRDKYTFEEMCEELSFVREMYDLMCEALGEKLMLNLSMYDFIDLIERNEDARDIIMVNYDFPSKATPKQIEELANKKTNELVDIIKEFKGSSLETCLTSGVVNTGQFKELAVLIGNKPDLYGNTIPLTSPTNNIKGFSDLAAYWVDSSGGRKAEVDSPQTL